MKDLTILLSTSPMRSHPSTAFVDEVIASFNKFLFKQSRANIIITCDGVRSPTVGESGDYEIFLHKLKDKYEKEKNISILINKEFGGLTGNLQRAAEYVDTEFIMLAQHDLSFLRSVDLNKVLEDMRNNPQLKHIRFNKRHNTAVRGDRHKHHPLGKWKVNANYKYISTPQWSDQNHVCTAEYFKNEILTRSIDSALETVFMERALWKETLGNAPTKQRMEERHDIFGTYLFGGHGDPPCICHLHGTSQGKKLKIPEHCCQGSDTLKNKLTINGDGTFLIKSLE